MSAPVRPASGDVRVATSAGSLVGVAGPSGLAFRGIAYAAAPVGPRRFLPPQRLGRSPDPIDARQAGLAPCQTPALSSAWLPPSEVGATGEDCLHLGVWTPALDGARRPVLVHVFGGGFERGGADGGVQNAAALSAYGDCVVVRVSFRLGALCFLYLGEAFGPAYAAGNVALLDLCAALGWVHDHIAALGGDPDNVTVFGLSSGAFMAAALFGVPAARGLFNRVWLQSGSASRIVELATATRLARDFLDAVQVRPGDVAALAALPVDRILAAQQRVVAVDLGERNAPGGRTFGIVDDGCTLSEHPQASLGAGAHRSVPVVLGSTRDEARLWGVLGVLEGPADEADLAREIERYVGARSTAGLLAAYRAALPGAPLAALRERFLGDAIYRIPALRTAAAQARAGGPAFVYRFDWVASGEPSRFGAAHGFDEPFVWHQADPARVPYLRESPSAAAVADDMADALLRLARSGDPGWPAFTASNSRTRLFGGPDEGMCEPDAAVVAAWTAIERR